MCVMSAVFDQYRPWVPQTTPHWPQPGVQPWTTPPAQKVMPQPDEVRELIDSLQKALDAARTFDRLTGQPDCEDPDKAKLLERVAELEKRLDEVEAQNVRAE